MKTIYIPKGETVCYESLVTDRLVIKGCLKVTYGIKAKSVSGNGVICAGTVEADVICADSVEAASVICKRLIAKRVQAPEVFASESAVVSCFLSAAYVETGKLTVTISEIDEVKAQEVVNLPLRKRSLFGTLAASLLRSFWLGLTYHAAKNPVMDAEYEQVEKKTEAESEASQSTMSRKDVSINATARSADVKRKTVDKPEPVDVELNRIIATFKLLRQGGYTLRLIPGTPEENAPVFDFESERIIRPAA